jgi:hypothetical protein
MAEKEKTASLYKITIRRADGKKVEIPAGQGLVILRGERGGFGIRLKKGQKMASF